MSDINPRGVEVTFGTETRHFLFDYAVIAEIQDAYDSDVVSVFKQMFLDPHSEGEYKARVLIDIVHKLLLDEVDREKYLHGRDDLKTYTKRQVGWLLNRGNADDIVKAIIDAWQESLPKTDEGDDDPNVTRGTGTEDSTSPEQS